MRRRELPREAFLGKMVVGHKNSKVIKTLSHERIVRRFAKIADIVGKMCVNCVQSIINMFYFRKYKFSSELREHSLNSQAFLYI